MRALEVSNLSFSYGDNLVFKNLNFSLMEGEVLAILGPNGSGKTTLLRLLLGDLTPKEGEIKVLERNRETYSRKEYSQLLSIARQEEKVAFEFTVLEYVLFGRSPHLAPLEFPGQADIQIALEALQIVGAEGLEDRYLPTLSGGERQLVIIARALAQKPKILLMDEPLAHLDLKNQDRLLELIEELKSKVTVVFTAHDPNAASLVAEQVLLLNHGNALAFGDSHEVLTEKWLSSTYDLPLKVLEVEGRRIVVPFKEN